jgi:hypothetical protein
MKDTIDKEKKKVAGKGDEPDLTLTWWCCDDDEETMGIWEWSAIWLNSPFLGAMARKGVKVEPNDISDKSAGMTQSRKSFSCDPDGKTKQNTVRHQWNPKSRGPKNNTAQICCIGGHLPSPTHTHYSPPNYSVKL